MWCVSYPEKPRYAYLKDYEAFINSTNEKNRSGAITDTYTGIWECGLVPSGSSVKEGRINTFYWIYYIVYFYYIFLFA